MSAECPYGLPIYGAPHMATRRHCTSTDMNSEAKSPQLVREENMAVAREGRRDDGQVAYGLLDRAGRVGG